MSVANYRESHRFPSGLYIDYDSDVEKEYVDDRDSISNQAELNNFQRKWHYLFEEIPAHAVDFDTFLWIKNSYEVQNKFIDDPALEPYLSIIAPVALLGFILRAREFGVTTGVVILQRWNGFKFQEMPDGAWRMT